MKKINFLAPVAMAFLLALQANAQDGKTNSNVVTVVVPEVALLDLESSGPVDFTATYTQSTEAGDKLSVPANNTDLWLNYSSTVDGVSTRSVQVKLGVAVPGVGISVVAAPSVTGDGALGTPEAAVTLTAVDQPLISGIGSAYTESGPSSGHQLTYAFTALDADYGTLVASSTPVTVTYTLTDI